jgi:hypothetical protein
MTHHGTSSPLLPRASCRFPRTALRAARLHLALRALTSLERILSA